MITDGKKTMNQNWEEKFDKTFLLDTLSNEIKNFIRSREQAIRAEHEHEVAASKILWERMTEWRKEWSVAHPDKPLTWPDALAMLEWKIEGARKEGKKVIVDNWKDVFKKDVNELIQQARTEALKEVIVELKKNKEDFEGDDGYPGAATAYEAVQALSKTNN